MGDEGTWFERWIDQDTWRWVLGLTYIVAIAAIWIAASYIVQSVVGAGVSPFLVTYICNSLFMIYIPLVEISRHFEDSIGNIQFWRSKSSPSLQQVGYSENINLLQESEHNIDTNTLQGDNGDVNVSGTESKPRHLERAGSSMVIEDLSNQVDAKGRWTRTRVAKVSLLICPFWFLAQLFFNLSLKYTTVTSNTILSSTSSLFTFLVSLAFLGEKFSWVKLISVLLCMGGTIIVSLADSSSGLSAVATSPLLGDILAVVAAALYAVYITLIRTKLPDENKGEGEASTAQFLGFLGLWNLLIFLPIALVLDFTETESFHKLKWKQFGLIVGKGLLDNVLSDYLWVKATQLTTTTVATAGLSIQVPIAAVVDSIAGKAPRPLEYLGAAFVMLGFAGINVPSDPPSQSQLVEQGHEQEGEGVVEVELAKITTL